jgi:hypothetical protein
MMRPHRNFQQIAFDLVAIAIALGQDFIRPRGRRIFKHQLAHAAELPFHRRMSNLQLICASLAAIIAMNLGGNRLCDNDRFCHSIALFEPRFIEPSPLNS